MFLAHFKEFDVVLLIPMMLYFEMHNQTRRRQSIEIVGRYHRAPKRKKVQAHTTRACWKQTRELIFHSVLHHIFHVKLVSVRTDYFSHIICYSKEMHRFVSSTNRKKSKKNAHRNEKTYHKTKRCERVVTKWQNEKKIQKKMKRLRGWKKNQPNTKCNWKYFVMWTNT